MKLKSSISSFAFCCIALVMLFSGCQTTKVPSSNPKIIKSEYSKVPNYSGLVEPIHSPIKIRYRPHPRSAFTKRGNAQMTFGAETLDTMFEIRGSISISQSGPSITQVIDFYEMLVKVQGEEKKESTQVRLKFRMTNRGKILGVDTYLPKTFDTLSKEEVERFAALMRIWMPVYPKNGVISGQNILIWEALKIKEIKGIRLEESTGVVRGITDFQGRKAIIVDLDAVMVSNNIRMRNRGYGLLADIH